MDIQSVAVLGAGTIGLSWAALFRAAGLHVAVFDPRSDVADSFASFWDGARPALKALGLDQEGAVSFYDDPAKAVQGCDFIQENAPERLAVKHDLYQRIEPALGPDTLIGSSTSGLTLGELQAGFRDPSRLIIAHPFNPPHLIPLVELMGNARTSDDALDRAEAFYHGLGKVCVRLEKEVPGHIANRLQAAVWREAISLAVEGVASVGDIDKAMAYGPGLRWAAMGPNALFHLGGGPAGIRGFCEHLGGPFQSWWNDLGTPDLTDDVVTQLEQGVAQAMGTQSHGDLAALRDQLVLDFILARRSNDA